LREFCIQFVYRLSTGKVGDVSRFCKKASGAVLPFKIKAMRDRIDNAVNAFQVTKETIGRVVRSKAVAAIQASAVGSNSPRNRALFITSAQRSHIWLSQ